MTSDKIKQEYILITSTNYPTGGAGATYLNLFCKGIKFNDFFIEVLLLKGFAFGNNIVTNKKKNITVDGIPYRYLSATQRPKNSILKIANDVVSIFSIIINLLSRIPKRKNTTILAYCNELQFNLPIYLISKLIGIRIISFVPEYYDKSVFDGSIGRKLNWYGFLINFNFLNRLSYKLIVFSTFLKGLYIKKSYPESDIIIQPNLTDFDYWKIDNIELKYTLGYSGTPSMKDGLHDLFKSIEILRKRGVETNLLVIGDAIFGNSLIPQLKNECAKLGIIDLVTFTGLVKVEEVKEYLSECKILTLTRPRTKQTQAGFPTKLGEYFASGKQILTTNFGDIERYFSKDSEMVIAECSNVEDIADKIQWIIEHPVEAASISQNGYRKAKSILEYQVSVSNILKAII
jgi:glycosyltransferase involved in cell wall biosynthesis